jgi:hypothetical protein
VLVTAENTSDKNYQFNQDFNKVNFKSLVLLNSKDNEEHYENKLGHEVDDYKQSAHQDRKWPVTIGPKGYYTWLIATSEDYNPSNIKSWGFR